MKKTIKNNQKTSLEATQESVPVENQPSAEISLEEMQRDIHTLARCAKTLAMQFEGTYRSDPGILSIKQDLSDIVYRYEKLKEK